MPVTKCVDRWRAAGERLEQRDRQQRRRNRRPDQRAGKAEVHVEYRTTTRVRRTLEYAKKGYRNLIDTTLLLTPNPKFSGYVNYDYGQNHAQSTHAGSAAQRTHRTGRVLRLSARGQMTANAALVARYEYFYDNQGFGQGSGSAEAERVHRNLRVQVARWSADAHGIPARLVESNALLRQGRQTGSGQRRAIQAEHCTIGLIAFFGPKR